MDSNLIPVIDLLLAANYPRAMFPDGYWASPIWKEAARAGLRQISKLVNQGNLESASLLAKTPGVLKPSIAGSQIQHLGRGGEGLATMVAHPEHGVAVRKLYDPRGISGSEMIARKEQAGKALGNNPTFAKFLGSAQTPSGGQMHFNEYIQPGQAPIGGQARAQSILHAQTQAQKALTQAGFAGGKDIREGNMIFDSNAGQHRVIDYIPARQGEFTRMPSSMANRLSVSPEANNPFNPTYSPQGSDSNGGMLRRLIGGKSQPGGVRESMNSIGTANTQPLQQQTVAGKGIARGTPQMSGQMSATSTTIASPPSSPIKPPAPTNVIKPKPALSGPATAMIKKPKPIPAVS